jgi:hypothetical protein
MIFDYLPVHWEIGNLPLAMSSGEKHKIARQTIKNNGFSSHSFMAKCGLCMLRPRGDFDSLFGLAPIIQRASDHPAVQCCKSLLWSVCEEMAGCLSETPRG